MKCTSRAKLVLAILRTRSSTSWMLTGLRGKLRVSPKDSIRSIRLRMRSVSAQISCVRFFSLSGTASSSSCAAPRMPASGFLISCASTAAMPCIERTAPRCRSWRSMRCARLRSCRVMMTAPSGSGSGVTMTSATRSPWRGVERSSVAFADRGAALARLRDQADQRTAERHQLIQLLLQQEAGAGVEELLRRRIDEQQFEAGAHHEHRHRQSAGDKRCRVERELAIRVRSWTA